MRQGAVDEADNQTVRQAPSRPQLKRIPLGGDAEQTVIGMDSYGKAQRKELRRLAGLAYERELSTALKGLEAQFHQWHAGALDAGRQGFLSS